MMGKFLVHNSCCGGGFIYWRKIFRAFSVHTEAVVRTRSVLSPFLLSPSHFLCVSHPHFQVPEQDSFPLSRTGRDTDNIYRPLWRATVITLQYKLKFQYTAKA